MSKCKGDESKAMLAIFAIVIGVIIMAATSHERCDANDDCSDNTELIDHIGR